MLVDLPSFLVAVAASVVARAAAQTPPVTVVLGGNLWVNQADESTQADPYGVLRPFGGSNDRTNPTPSVSVQLRVAGTDDMAAQRFAQAVFEAIVLDQNGREARMVAIAGVDLTTLQPDGTHWMLVAAQTINRPGQLSRDERGRASVVANFSLGFYPLN